MIKTIQQIKQEILSDTLEKTPLLKNEEHKDLLSQSVKSDLSNFKDNIDLWDKNKWYEIAKTRPPFGYSIFLGKFADEIGFFYQRGSVVIEGEKMKFWGFDKSNRKRKEIPTHYFIMSEPEGEGD